MDSKITKRRLSDFLAYEWILIVIVALVAVVVFEVIYSINRVKPTTGQQFKMLFDQGVRSTDVPDFENRFLVTNQYKNGKLFSYDIIDAGVESMVADYNVLSTRLELQDGDVIATDILQDENGASRAKIVIDSFDVYCYDDLAIDAQNYLATFLKGEFSEKSEEEKRALALDYNNLDEAKIDSGFEKRLSKDNRFRKASQKQEGKKLERERIKNLCEDTSEFLKLLEKEEYFYTYKKYEYSLAQRNDTDSQDYKNMQKDADTAPKKYGLKVGAINRERADKHFSSDNGKKAYTSEMSILCVFNFKEYQPELQFECISFINEIVDYLI